VLPSTSTGYIHQNPPTDGERGTQRPAHMHRLQPATVYSAACTTCPTDSLRFSVLDSIREGKKRQPSLTLMPAQL
jgi:hypothetical protein